MIYNVFLVFLGSGLGGVCRWGTSMWLNGNYPFGTLAVNVMGCFLIGALSKLLPCDANLKLLFITGFCGGFTTFSTFINENFLMMRGTQLFISIGYILLSIMLGLIAAWGGWNMK